MQDFYDHTVKAIKPVSRYAHQLAILCFLGLSILRQNGSTLEPWGAWW